MNDELNPGPDFLDPLNEGLKKKPDPLATTDDPQQLALLKAVEEAADAAIAEGAAPTYGFTKKLAPPPEGLLDFTSQRAFHIGRNRNTDI